MTRVRMSLAAYPFPVSHASTQRGLLAVLSVLCPFFCFVFTAGGASAELTHLPEDRWRAHF